MVVGQAAVHRENGPLEQLGVRPGQFRPDVTQRDAPLADQLGAPQPDLGAVGLGEVPALPAPQRADRAPVDGERGDGTQQRAQLFGRGAGAGQRTLGDQAERVHPGQQHVGEDVLLAPEVPVDGGAGDACGAGDVVDADLVVPILAEQLGGSVGELRLAVARAPGRRPGCFRHGPSTRVASLASD
jgi:hypothetical protein